MVANTDTAHYYAAHIVKTASCKDKDRL